MQKRIKSYNFVGKVNVTINAAACIHAVSGLLLVLQKIGIL